MPKKNNPATRTRMVIGLRNADLINPMIIFFVRVISET